MARLVRWTAALAAALLVAGCGGGPSGSGGDEGKNSSGPSALTSQRLDWGTCKGTADSPAPGGDWQCATLKAPLDWSKPDGETIGIALVRAKASGGGGKRIGSLLFNFGGPGASGVSTMPLYATTVSKLRERYDLVSWDPRGVGGSEGVRCRSDKAVQAAESVDATPDNAAEEKAYLQDAADFGKS